MKKSSNNGLQIFILIMISVALYLAHFFIFRDLMHITIFGLSDFAFMPIEVIFVTIIFHRMLNNDERKKKISKLYMIIEGFFAELGIELLRVFAQCDRSYLEIESVIRLEDDWNDKDYKKAVKLINNHTPKLVMEGKELEVIDMMLLECRPVLLSLLENPALLEHETFTELLMAVFHLAEELRLRYDFETLSKSDKAHLIADTERAYTQLAEAWLVYLNHMRTHYPHIFCLSVRNNPFEAIREVEVKPKKYIQEKIG